MRALVTGTRSIDQMVEAAIWMMVQGDRAGAEELLAQVLRIDPTHERARQAMKSTGAQTSPGTEMPKAPLPQQTQPAIPPGTIRISEATPLEPVPALQREVPPGLTRRTTLSGTGGDALSVEVPPGKDIPFVSSPSAIEAEKPTLRVSASDFKREERTDRHLTLVPPELSQPTPPPLDAVEAPRTGTQPSLGRSWSLEVLTGPHTGTSLPVARRPMLIGKGLGVLDVEEDLFMSHAHASFFQRGGELWISDGGSASGTWISIDGPQRINPGDSFSVGLQRLKYLGPLDTSPIEAPWPYGAPRPAASWRLEHVLVGARAGRTWVLRGMVTIGREGTTLRFGDDDTMALVHCELRPAGAALELIDRSARVGTFVALPSGGERRVLEGQRVRLGSTVFRVTAR
jgi:hypothetical protein